MPLLVIRDWTDLFENNRTRELKKLDWLPLPNDLSSDGYTELITHRRGPSHFAVWIVLLQMASRCEPRGFLIRSNRVAHDFASISRVTRMPVKLIAEAVERLLAIGWLETKELSDEISHPAAPKPQETDASRARVPEGKERREGVAPTCAHPTAEECGLPVDQFFEERYALHPKKGHRTAAEQRMSDVPGIATAGEQAEFVRVHNAWISSEEWRWKNGAKAPHFDEWIFDQGYRYPPPATEEPIAESTRYLSMGEQDELVRRAGGGA